MIPSIFGKKVHIQIQMNKARLLMEAQLLIFKQKMTIDEELIEKMKH